jgi:hypothetical protein
MRSRRSCLVVAVLLTPVWAHASGHNFDAMGSACLLHINPSQSQSASAAVAGVRSAAKAARRTFEPDPKVSGVYFLVAKTLNFYPKLSVLADATWNAHESGKQDRETLSQKTLLLGSRFEFLKRRVTPFVQILPLGLRVGNQDLIRKSGMSAVGGAVEWKLAGAEGAWGLRAGYDRLIYWKKKPQDRAYFGLVFRYYSHPETHGAKPSP